MRRQASAIWCPLVLYLSFLLTHHSLTIVTRHVSPLIFTLHLPVIKPRFYTCPHSQRSQFSIKRVTHGLYILSPPCTMPIRPCRLLTSWCHHSCFPSLQAQSQHLPFSVLLHVCAAVHMHSHIHTSRISCICSSDSPVCGSRLFTHTHTHTHTHKHSHTHHINSNAIILIVTDTQDKGGYAVSTS